MLSVNKLAKSETLKKVLIISYYWPPAGGSGVQRWVKFAKYLPESGWQPIVYTPSNPEYPSLDNSLTSEVTTIPTITHPIFEPYSLYRRFTGTKDSVGAGFVSEKESHGFAKKFAVWIRGNLFIPDARLFFIKTSISRLSKFLKENNVDAIVSTGPPHSMHLIAKELSKKFQLPWLADFRDPWTKVYYFNDLKPGKWARKRQEKLETEVLTKADSVVLVTKGTAVEMNSIVPRKYHVITNGYDAHDFSLSSLKAKKEKNETFVITYSGTLLPSQLITAFWDALSLLKSDYSFEIHFYGRIDISTKNYISNVGLDSYCTYFGYIDHDLLIEKLLFSDCNLLILPNLSESDILIPGKLFEYLAAKRPIFSVGTPNSEIADLIDSHNAGYYHTFDDATGILKSLRSLFEDSQTQFSFDSVEKYSRKNLTKEIATILDQMTSQ